MIEYLHRFAVWQESLSWSQAFIGILAIVIVVMTVIELVFKEDKENE
jgi:hypothetical protein